MLRLLQRPGALRRIGSALCIGVALTGCSILNPHIAPPAPPASYQGKGFAGGLPRAIDDANQLRTAYYDAVGEQSKLRNGLALTLIPLSATALFFGITSPDSRGTRDFITGTVIGGGAAYGLGSLFLNESRQAVYLAGSRAIGCAVMAMRPYLMTEAQFREMQELVAETGLAASRVSTDIRTVEALIGTGSRSSEVTVLLSTAREQLRKGETTRQAGQELVARIVTAEMVLDSAVANIRDKVAEQILKTEPNLQAVMAINSGLRQLGVQVMPAQLAGALPAAKQADGVALQAGRSLTDLYGDAVARLNSNLDALARANNALAVRVEAVNALAKVAGDPMACEPADAVNRLAILPSAERVSLAPGQKYPIIVFGGTGIPTAEFAGLKTPDVTVDRLVRGNNYVVEVTVAAKPMAGERLLVISDASGRDWKAVALDVGGAPSGTGTGQGSRGTGGTGTNRPTVIDPLKNKPPSKPDAGQIRELQRLLGIADPTAEWDANAQTVIKAWQTLCKMPATGTLTSEQIDHLRKVGRECPQ